MKIEKQSINKQMPKSNGNFSCSFLFLVSFFSFHGSTCDAQATNFTRVECYSSDESPNPSAFLANFNASYSDLHANISAATSSRFSTTVQGGTLEPVYAIFHCRGYLSHADCIACLDVIFGLATTICKARYRGTVYNDGCYLRYATTNMFGEIFKPGQSGFCDDTSEASEPSGLYTAAMQALNDLTREVVMRNGQFVAAKKAADGGGSYVYVAGECMPILGRADCQNCLEAGIRNIEGCLPEAAEGRVVESACFVRYSGRAFFNESQLQVIDLDQRPARGKSRGRNVLIGFTVGAGAGLIVLSTFLLLVFFCCSAKETEWVFPGHMEGLSELQWPMAFTYKELKSATRNFRDQNKLGQGGFSSVYKGILSNGKVVAVKKLLVSETEQARIDFESEVTLISNIHHRNLLRLLGCCRKGPDLLLVYEFMENGSINRYISGDKRAMLNWKGMFDIILGTARGLSYLHEEFHHCVIHRDIKPANILLDDELQPKIADFGLARLLPEDRTHVNTRLAGTLGYTAPEYILQGKLSEKVDAYGFGVVVLEIISGKRCNDINIDSHTTYLLDWAWRLCESDLLMELVDKSLDASEIEQEEIKKVIEIGLACTQSDSKRPAMSDVVAMLLSKDYPRFELTRPSFITKYVDGSSSGYSYSSPSSATNATMLASNLSGR